MKVGGTMGLSQDSCLPFFSNLLLERAQPLHLKPRQKAAERAGSKSCRPNTQANAHDP